jgi:Ca-activated chloride channel family protein
VLWVRWGGFNKFWSQVVRWTLRTGTRSDTVATVSRTDDVGEVLVDAIDAKGEFINFLDSQVGVVAPDKTRTVIDLEQIGPGRYRGRFPAAQEGVYLVGMAQRRGEEMVGSQLAGLVVPYGPEFRDLGVDETMLRELSELTGGGVLNKPKDAFLQNRRPSRLAFGLWPWLVGLVTVMLIPEIALRRIGPGIFAGALPRLKAGRARGQGGPGNERPNPV